MGQFFTRERFGRPQFVAGVLLLVFVAQCAWLVYRRMEEGQTDSAEVSRIQQGLTQWRGGPIAGTNGGEELASNHELSWPEGYDQRHSPLWYLIASAPLLIWRGELAAEQFRYWGWLSVAPYLVIGALLGASLWYVSRRLYGNEGGYIALVLYCFAPGVLRMSSLWAAQPEGAAAWGAFGAIFTAIAVAHTLYAPREVILWNWRRIILLALSFTLAVGDQFSLLIVLPLALAFMLYVAPTRRGAAVTIWAAACALAALLLFAAYFFHSAALAASLRHAEFSAVDWRAFGMGDAYRRMVTLFAESSPALLIAAPAAMMVFIAWKRARYFGNAAPLIVAGIFFVLGLGSPHYPGTGFILISAIFLMVFVAGVSADILETRYRSVVQPAIWGLLVAYAVWNVVQLSRA